jgi:hypothetical protein
MFLFQCTKRFGLVGGAHAGGFRRRAFGVESVVEVRCDMWGVERVVIFSQVDIRKGNVLQVAWTCIIILRRDYLTFLERIWCHLIVK